MSGLPYVYAICRPFPAALSAELTGVAGVPPKLLRHDDLVAVVGSVPDEEFAAEPLRRRLEDVAWLEATARAHQGVIDALTGVTSPLPLRLATVLRDESGVRVMMEERREEFLTTLDRLDGRVEWDVKVYADTAGASGYTGERADGLAHRLHATLAGRATETRLHAPQSAAPSDLAYSQVLNAAYLVPRAESEQFVERVNRGVREQAGLRVELTGPWAAYSFTELPGLSGFTDLAGFTRTAP
ncbi:GvpL/GvpF family gas vesicle protein [Streptomyces sp. NPDC059759]|uniref:GvpL/GvpF family gas vesicle protein n=1 Tax=Streptomyces sp. NPDC059759 TaxID=3346936 RepID=UPI00364DB24C